jgi:hypothetical protein
METPGEENGAVRLIVVRKPALIERHTGIVSRGWRISHLKRRPTGGSAADQGVRPTKQRCTLPNRGTRLP